MKAQKNVTYIKNCELAIMQPWHLSSIPIQLLPAMHCLSCAVYLLDNWSDNVTLAEKGGIQYNIIIANSWHLEFHMHNS